MKKRVMVLEGDGIGPEIVREAVRVLENACSRHGVEVDFKYGLIGGASIDANGIPLTDETIADCKASDAVLLGAVGGPKWDGQEGSNRPEAGLLKIRKEMGLYANLRPMVIHPKLLDKSPLRMAPDALPNLLMVRELTGGIYFGERGGGSDDKGQFAWDTECYWHYEVDRIGQLAFKLAEERGKCLHSIDKANVLDSSRLWRNCISEMGEQHQDVALSHMYVDNCAMQLILNPSQFDVVLTSNMFGDILSDEMSALAGSIGLMPSASLGDGSIGLYEPIHGSAPDLAGQDKANPAGTILSAAMMARYSLGLPQVAEAIEKAVWEVISHEIVTIDLAGENRKVVGTHEFGDCVMKALEKKLVL